MAQKTSQIEVTSEAIRNGPIVVEGEKTLQNAIDIETDSNIVRVIEETFLWLEQHELRKAIMLVNIKDYQEQISNHTKQTDILCQAIDVEKKAVVLADKVIKTAKQYMSSLRDELRKIRDKIDKENPE